MLVVQEGHMIRRQQVAEAEALALLDLMEAQQILLQELEDLVALDQVLIHHGVQQHLQGKTLVEYIIMQVAEAEVLIV